MKRTYLHSSDIITRKPLLLFLAYLLLLSAFTCSATNYYVRPEGGNYGLENGSSWANAFDGMADVNIGAGDILYVAAGLYTVGLDVDNAITDGGWKMRAAQEGYVGLAIFDGGNAWAINFRGYDNITVDGSGPNGERNFVFRDNVLGSASPPNYGVNLSVSHCTFTNAVFFAPYCSGVRQTNNIYKLDAGTGEDFVFSNNGSNNGNNYDQAWFVNCQVYIPGKNDADLNGPAGNGPDGIQPGHGTTIVGCKFQSFLGTSTSTEHQDQIQVYGNNYLKVVGCEFIDSGDAQFGGDMADAAGAHIRVYNCIFRRTIANMGGPQVRIYTSINPPLTSLNDMVFEGNTFTDANRAPTVPGAIRIHDVTSSTTSTGCIIRNNIFYNCGAVNANAIQIEGGLLQTGWTFSHNLINAGSAGNTSTSGWTQSNGQTGAPSFVSYTPYSINNDLSLTGGDTAARNNGATATLAYDFAGLARPQGLAWDIGAYEFKGFVTTGSMNTGRAGHAAVWLPSIGKVLVVGGGVQNNALSEAELYNPTTGDWTTTTYPMIVERAHPTATLLGNGKVLVVGGLDLYGNPLCLTELYNPSTGTWAESFCGMMYGRYFHTATLLPSGKVLVVGGVSSDSSAELYDPTVDYWSQAYYPNTARSAHTATWVPSISKVLIVGGFNSGGYTANVELYNPTADTMAYATAIPTARAHHTATLLSTGKILVVGGLTGSGYTASAKLYNPANDTWSNPTGNSSMSTPRAYHTATVLPNGQVLIAGGYNNGGMLSSAELYDPTAETFTATDSMDTPRHFSTATLLTDGRVLVVGGVPDSDGTDLSSAELYESEAAP